MSDLALGNGWKIIVMEESVRHSGNAVKHFPQCVWWFQNRRVGPAADKPRRPTMCRRHPGGPALALLAGPTLRSLDSNFPKQMLHSVAEQQ